AFCFFNRFHNFRLCLLSWLFRLTWLSWFIWLSWCNWSNRLTWLNWSCWFISFRISSIVNFHCYIITISWDTSQVNLILIWSISWNSWSNLLRPIAILSCPSRIFYFLSYSINSCRSSIGNHLFNFLTCTTWEVNNDRTSDSSRKISLS